MILATFENTDKTKKAEVCQQDNILVIKMGNHLEILLRCKTEGPLRLRG